MKFEPSTPRSQNYKFASISHVRTQHAHVVREIGMAIVSGDIDVGETLPSDSEMIEQFGVSRTVLREALKTIAGKGMVQAKTRIGTRVRPREDWNFFDADLLVWHAEAGVDELFLDQLTEMRFALEPQAAALAAERRTDSDLAALSECVADMETSKDNNAFVLSDLRFHMAVTVASANPFMRSLSGLIEVALYSMLTVSSPINSTERMKKSIADHRAIVRAIAARDKNAAREAMLVVIRDGIRFAKLAQMNITG